MRKDFYTIADVSTMTMLSTRTIRTYIKNGFLNGSKKDGTWIFTEEEVGRFFSEQFVKQSIQIKYESLVRDFMDSRQKTVNSVCSIIDYVVNSYEEVELLCDKVIEQINTKQYGDISFSFNYDDKINMARVILVGETKNINKIMQIISE